MVKNYLQFAPVCRSLPYFVLLTSSLKICRESMGSNLGHGFRGGAGRFRGSRWVTKAPSNSNAAGRRILRQVLIDRALSLGIPVHIAASRRFELSEQSDCVSARAQGGAFAAFRGKQVLMMRSAVSHNVDPGDAVVQVDAIGAFRPCFVHGWDPQVPLVASIRHMGPKAQCQVRDDVIRGRVFAKPVPQVVYRVAVQSVGIVDLPTLVRPKDGAPYRRQIIEEPMDPAVPSGAYRPVVRVAKGDLEKGNVPQDRLELRPKTWTD